MWCLPCCSKPSTSEDRFEAETSHVILVSQHEADIQKAKQLSLATHEAEQLDLAIQESSRLRQQEEEEEKRRTRELENDAQIANGLLYEERERQIQTALEDEQVKKDRELAERLNMLESPPQSEDNYSISRRGPLNIDEQLEKVLEKSSKEKGIGKQFEDEQVKKDRELAERLYMLESPPQSEDSYSITRRGPLNVAEQLEKVLEKSSKENGKGKQFEDEQVKKDRELAERLYMLGSPPQSEDNYSISRRGPLNVDEQLEKVLEKSSKEKGKGKQFKDEQVKKDRELAERLNMLESPPRLEDEQRIILENLKGKGQIIQSKEEVEEDGKLLEVNPSRSMCGGCKSAVDHGRSVNVSGVLWHPKCLICHACDKKIAIHEVENHVSNSRGKFHKPCYERYCYVCKNKKMIAFNHHPFWEEERYCPAHDTDGTPKCCSCERLEPRGTNYVMLGDGRWLCLECMDSAVMDSDECQPLHFDMRDFFEGLNMKIDKEFPFLLVEKQALNKAEKEEKIDYQYEVVTRGICLSEEQIVDSVTQKPIRGPNNKLIGLATEPQRVVRKCEVTAILILYGLPRLLTGYILAHEMMHAYLRLNGHRVLNNVLEEGICQVLGHMWLESQTYAAVDDTAAAASSSSSRAPPASASKKGEWSDFEKKLVEFCKHQIETDESRVYGDGFRKVNEMVTNSNLPDTLKEITRRS